MQKTVQTDVILDYLNTDLKLPEQVVMLLLHIATEGSGYERGVEKKLFGMTNLSKTRIRNSLDILEERGFLDRAIRLNSRFSENFSDPEIVSQNETEKEESSIIPENSEVERHVNIEEKQEVSTVSKRGDDEHKKDKMTFVDVDVNVNEHQKVNAFDPNQTEEQSKNRILPILSNKSGMPATSSIANSSGWKLPSKEEIENAPDRQAAESVKAVPASDVPEKEEPASTGLYGRLAALGDIIKNTPTLAKMAEDAKKEQQLLISKVVENEKACENQEVAEIPESNKSSDFSPLQQPKVEFASKINQNEVNFSYGENFDRFSVVKKISGDNSTNFRDNSENPLDPPVGFPLGSPPNKRKEPKEKNTPPPHPFPNPPIPNSENKIHCVSNGIATFQKKVIAKNQDSTTGLTTADSGFSVPADTPALPFSDSQNFSDSRDFFEESQPRTALVLTNPHSAPLTSENLIQAVALQKTSQNAPAVKKTGKVSVLNADHTRQMISKADLELEFNIFWQIYQNKVGKAAAKKHFAAARQRAPLAEIINGLHAYQNGKPKERAWLNPATFLNQDRWEDRPANPDSFDNQIIESENENERISSIVKYSRNQINPERA